MPIPITCPSCETSARVPDRFAGKRVKCKKCGQALTVPEADDPGGFGDTFSPDALPARSTGSRNDSAREAVSWETFRAGAMVASWGGLLGALGMICFGVSIGVPMLLANDPNAFGDPATLLLVVFVVSIFGAIASVLQIAYSIAAASVCNSSKLSNSSKKWIGAGGLMLRVSILVVAGFPAIMFSGLNRGLGPDTGPLLVLGLVTTSTVTYYAGYAAFAAGIGGVVGSGLEKSGLTSSAMLFGLYEVALISWFLVQMFLLDGLDFAGRAGGFAPGRQDEGFRQVLIWVVLLIVHFFWFRDIASRGAKAIAEHQTSLVGDA